MGEGTVGTVRASVLLVETADAIRLGHRAAVASTRIPSGALASAEAAEGVPTGEAVARVPSPQRRLTDEVAVEVRVAAVPRHVNDGVTAPSIAATEVANDEATDDVRPAVTAVIALPEVHLEAGVLAATSRPLSESRLLVGAAGPRVPVPLLGLRPAVAATELGDDVKGVSFQGAAPPRP